MHPTMMPPPSSGQPINHFGQCMLMCTGNQMSGAPSDVKANLTLGSQPSVEISGPANKLAKMVQTCVQQCAGHPHTGAPPHTQPHHPPTFVPPPQTHPHYLPTSMPQPGTQSPSPQPHTQPHFMPTRSY